MRSDAEELHQLTVVSTPACRSVRDFAISRLLCRLGLRCIEITRLELDDIDWRSGQIVIHGNARRVDTLPLAHDVGVADYSRSQREYRTTNMALRRLRAPKPDTGDDVRVNRIFALPTLSKRESETASHVTETSVPTLQALEGHRVANSNRSRPRSHSFRATPESLVSPARLSACPWAIPSP